MKIVVLDGYTLNPGDLSWQALEARGSGQLVTLPMRAIEHGALGPGKASSHDGVLDDPLRRSVSVRGRARV